MRALFLAIPLALAGLPALAEDLRPTMTISAIGAATASPDQAVVHFGVETTGHNAQIAMSENAEKMTAVFDALGKVGVGPEDIATSGLSMHPRIEHDKNREPRILGYSVSNQVSATIDDLESLGIALDALVKAGANQIRSVSFGIDDTSELEAQARRDAAQSARAKAEAYADALGTEILGIISVSEGGAYKPMPYQAQMMRADSAMAVPVSASDIDVTVSLNVVFELSGAME